MAFINRNKRLLLGREMEFMYKWLCRLGQHYIYRHRNVPELLLSQYHSTLIDKGLSFPTNTDETRLNVITSHIEYITIIYPRFKKYLKAWKMRGYEIGMLYGFSSAKSWHNSYKKPQYIRALLAVIDKNEALLSELNNPK